MLVQALPVNMVGQEQKRDWSLAQSFLIEPPHILKREDNNQVRFDPVTRTPFITRFIHDYIFAHGKRPWCPSCHMTIKVGDRVKWVKLGKSKVLKHDTCIHRGVHVRN